MNPEDIKLGIECCIKYLACVRDDECCDACPYQGRCSQLEKDALAYIQQLEERLKMYVQGHSELEAAKKRG